MPSSGGLEMIMNLGGGGPSKQDAYTAINYIKSIDMIRFLNDLGLDLRGHFSNADRDWFYKLPEDASEQELHKYFQKRIDAHFDDAEGIVKLEVQAFDPEYAMLLAHALITRAGTYLNETNRTIAAERMKFVLDELEASEARLEAAQGDLIKFQNKNLVIDPVEETKAKLALIQELRTQKIMLRAKINDLTRRSPHSPVISEYTSEYNSLDQEMIRESQTLTGDGPDQMNQLNINFARLNQSLTFANLLYEQTLAVAEEIRVQSIQAHRFLIVIEKPFRPEEAAHPRRIYMSISVIFIGFLAIQLVTLLAQTVLEH
ncbi:MAG: hypothetical protein P1V20_29440 [Verrucomicrobiales bacterium]|nr:hypothetical protein [Verrucomicrobiales bacterium]